MPTRLLLIRLTSGLAAAIGLLVLLAWALDIEGLKTVLHGGAQMKANTALGVVLAGSALQVVAAGPGPARYGLSLVLALVVMVLGLASAAQHLWGWRLGIDELLFADPGAVDRAWPGRMSSYSAWVFAMIGLAIALLPSARLRPLVWLLATPAVLLGVAGLLGYVWNVNELIQPGLLPTVAVHTALCFCLLGGATLLASTEHHRGSEPSLLKRTSIELKVAGGFFGVILMLVIGGGVTYRANLDATASARRVAHVHEVRARLAQRYATISDVEAAALVYLVTPTPAHQQAFTHFVSESRRRAWAYGSLVQHDAVPPEWLRRLDTLELDRISSLERIMSGGGGAAAIVEAVAPADTTRVMDALRDLTGDLDDRESALLLLREAVAGHDRQRALLFLYLTLAGAGGIFVLLSHAIRREMLARSGADERVRSLNAELESRVEQRTAALAHSSALYRHTLDNMLEGCQVIDFELRYRYVNAAAARQNRREAGELVGRTLAEAHPGIEATDIYAIVTGCLHDRVPRHREHEYVHADGVHAWFQVSAMPAPDGVSLFSVDITERRRAEAEILAANAELERRVQARTFELELAREAAEAANRAKSAFLATMSHEIRTPMNGIVGMVEVLFHSEMPEAQTDAVHTIRQSAFSLLRVIDDVLDFSKIEAGRLDLERVPVPLVELIEGVCDTLLPMALDGHVDLSLFIAPAVPAQIWSDPTRLRQVLFNLAGNAIKFGAGEPQRCGHVSVRVELQPASGDDLPLLRLAFTDDGIGMAADTQARLFSPFTQAEASTTRRFGGTGLGLTICKRLVLLLGGDIAVHSELGRGSTFTVSLPIEAVADAAAPTLSDLTLLKCVVVGTDATAADLQAYLVAAGAEVHAVPDLAQAVQQAGRLGRPVVVQSSWRDKTSVEAVRTAFAGMPEVHHVLIERGQRRGARIAAADIVSVDGNCLRRATLLRAVAVAAGRRSPEVFRDPGADALVGERSAPPTIAEARARGRLILIAEDDDVNRKVIQRQIEMLGHAAEIAHDGAEALALWQAGHYGLLLTDLHMPGMDGYALTEAIRRQEAADGPQGRARMPILALTANALRGEAIRAQAAGMDEYLTKPLPLLQLQAVLVKWLPQDSADAAPQLPHDATQPPAAPGAAIDAAVLQRLVGDDPATVHELLTAYRESTRRQLAELLAADATGDGRLIAEIAHKLKSSSRAVGARKLGDLCAELENACRAGTREGIAQSRATLATALHAIDAELR